MSKFFTTIVAVFLLVPAVRAQHTITTVAGGVPNNVNALSVGIQPGSGLARDSVGNLYIADGFNSAIFKITLSGTLSTIAGNATQSFSGDGGPATSAGLATPSGVFVDGSGNIFVADNGNNRIRKIDASTGLIQTVAGNGSFGFGGDGGPATSATLAGPAGVFVDNAGNIFIADNQNSRIREVVASTGTIQTVAGNGSFGFGGDGGPATSAELSGPTGVAVDIAGNIFIADSSNNRIRKVLAATSMIQTVAGNGNFGFGGDGGPATSATLAGPAGVFVDNAGNIFIADAGNNRIREATASTGTILTIAGNGTFGFGGDGGPATNAELGPTGVLVDSNGNIFIADILRVREVVSSSGIIETVAGNGTVDFSGDGVPATNAEIDDASGVFVDGAGNIFIADNQNGRIREVFASTGKIQTVAGGGNNGLGDGGAATLAELTTPFGVFVDGSGNIYIADLLAARIREVSGSSGEIQTVAGNGISGSSGDGGPATLAELNSPFSVFVDGSGNIFISDLENQNIREVVASTGTIQTVAGNGTFGFSGDGGPATNAEFNNPTGVFVDPAGNIFIADSGNDRIREVVASTGTIQTVAGNGTFGFSGDGGPATSAQLAFPEGVFVDDAGNIFIADSSNNRIREVVASTGTIQTVAGNGSPGFSGDGGPAFDANLDFPNAIWGDAEGNLFIADSGNNRIRMVAGLTSVPASTLSALDTFTGAQPSQTATLTNTGSAPLLISSIAITGTNPADFTFGNPTTCPMNGGSVQAGESCTLTIALSSSVISTGSTSGTVSGSATLTIALNAANGTPTPATGTTNGQFQQAIPLAVNYAAPVLSFSPASVTFTTVNVSQTLTLQNNGNTPLIVTGITPPAGFTLGGATSNGCVPLSPSTAAPLTISGNGTCNLGVTFTGSGGSTNGSLTFVDDGFAPTGNQSVALNGFALIVTNGPSFTISNSAPSPSTTANLEVLGPATVTYNILCVVAPAGLIITCPTTPVAANTSFSAVISIPSCAVEPLSLPKQIGWPFSVLVASILGLFFVRRGLLGRLAYVPLSIAVICFAVLLVSCSTGKTSSAGCVASVTTSAFQATITATPANNSSVPTVTTVPSIPITVTH